MKNFITIFFSLFALTVFGQNVTLRVDVDGNQVTNAVVDSRQFTLSNPSNVFYGNGANLTGVSAGGGSGTVSNFTSLTNAIAYTPATNGAAIAASQLPASVALLNSNQSFTGINTFTNTAIATVTPAIWLPDYNLIGFGSTYLAGIWATIFWNPSHSLDPEWQFGSAASISFLAGGDNQHKSVIQFGNPNATHEQVYISPDSGAEAGTTISDWPTNGSAPSKIFDFDCVTTNGNYIYTGIRSEIATNGNGVTPELDFLNPVSWVQRVQPTTFSAGTKQLRVLTNGVIVPLSLTVTGQTNTDATASQFASWDSNKHLTATLNGSPLTNLTAANITGAIPLASTAISATNAPDGNTISSLNQATNAALGVANNSQTTKAAALYATTAALPSNIYANGTAGVGATLTGVLFGALTVDGNTPNIGDRLVIKNEADATHNGIYTMTLQGAGATLYILTRGADYNSSSNIVEGDQIPVVSGTANTNTMWELTETTNTPVVVGTTALNFFQVAPPYVLPSSANFNSLNVGTLVATNPVMQNGLYLYPLPGIANIGISNCQPTLCSITWVVNTNEDRILITVVTTGTAQIAGIPYLVVTNITPVSTQPLIPILTTINGTNNTFNSLKFSPVNSASNTIPINSNIAPAINASYSLLLSP
jgi:hypothetical protein